MRTAHRSGFSMVEVLFAMAIGTVIAGGVIALLMSQAQLSATQNRNMLNQENIRDVVRFLTDEIMLANTYDGTEPIITANVSDMSFYADIDGDNVIDTISYYISNGDLKRDFTTTAGGGSAASDVLLPGVQSVSFTYYAIDNAAPASIDEITSVEVQLVLDTSGGTALNTGKLRAQAMVGRVTIRNKLLN